MSSIVASRQPPRGIAEALGGPLGMAESALPPITFVAAYSIVGLAAATAAWVALGVGGALAAARVVRGQTVQYALAGLVGVGLAAFIVSRTGRAEDFFVPGLLANAGYALACVVSNALRRPAVGILLGAITGEGGGWRNEPTRVRAYSLATWVWAGIFSLRLAVQLPLYLGGAVVALGTARVAMGLPLYLLGIWLTWLLIRGAGPVLPGARRQPED